VEGSERRKFTIAELKRICAFPDDYILTGSYADQWARCGNAVPPVMMFHIASALVPVLIGQERRQAA
jgi:DNA (cytosine-5)-methyltransferase 1